MTIKQRKNPIAKDLRTTTKYSLRVVAVKKQYNRKKDKAALRRGVYE